MKETALYQPVKEYFQELGYEVYSEVLCNEVPNGVAYADVVLKYNNIITVIELKKSLSLDLLEQTIKWKNVAHYVYACILEPKNHKVNDFAKKVLTDYGLGLITVEFSADDKDCEYGSVRKILDSKLSRKICCNWNEYLTEDHKYNTGGGTAGGWITPYSSTMNQVKHCLKYNGAMTIDEILKICTTHYMHPKQGIYKALTEIEKDWCESFRMNGKTYFKIRDGYSRD